MKRLVLSLCLFCALLSGAVAGEAKYVFYFIGDGMGQNQVLATEMYLAELEGRIGTKPLCFTQFPVTGQCTTFSTSNGITDSSAAGTALASGAKTKNGTLGLLPDGSAVYTIAEQLRDAGWGVGITTSVSIDHATPAAFYAHVDSRGEYYKIGTQLAASGFDFFGGATFYHPFPKENPGDAESLYEICRKAGYTFARGYTDYQNKKEDAGKMILIQEHEGLTDDYKGEGMIPYLIDRSLDDLSLTQITEAAIDFLSSRHNKFFLMVEGGAIDWACHSNDAATAIHDVIDMDNAVRLAFEFYLQHPDETLIVVTADHETGGMALGNSNYTLNLQLLQNQRMSVGELSGLLKKLHEQQGRKLRWESVRQLFADKLGFYTTVELTPDEDKALQQQFKQLMKGKAKKVKTLYKELDGLTASAVALLDKKSKIGWTTGSHSASAVGVWAIGVGAEEFTGWQDETQLAPKIMSAVEK
ncbi:MAG: alkaline phosphatase [Paludibacteraceae bacterium]|nr:alkaline phosphatase [Paludibacteraceae bacterium]